MDYLISNRKNLSLDLQLSNAKTYEMVCYCSIHGGECLHQLEANLPNGKWVSIMEDHEGYHVLILPSTPTGQWWHRYKCPVAVSESEVLEMLLEALG